MTNGELFLLSDTVSTQVNISVLVPAYNEELLIGEALGSVRDSFAAAGRSDYETVVCDNDSSDATAERAREFGARVVFEEHNQIARARNAAARAARGKWLIFIDADSRLTPGLLRRTLENLESGKICGGGARVEMEEPLDRAMKAGLGFWNTVSRWFRIAPGSYVYCARAAWEETGGFDERYYAGEEIAFSRSLKKWGRRRGLGFEIINDCALLTSSRKAEQFSLGQMLGQVLVCCIPGSLRRRDRCGFWYTRPATRSGGGEAGRDG